VVLFDMPFVLLSLSCTISEIQPLLCVTMCNLQKSFDGEYRLLEVDNHIFAPNTSRNLTISHCF